MPSRLRLACRLGAALATLGCADSPTADREAAIPGTVAPPMAAMTETERSSLHPGVDPVALQRLIDAVPMLREQVIRQFSAGSDEPEPLIVGFSDARLQNLFESVIAPQYRRGPTEAELRRREAAGATTVVAEAAQADPHARAVVLRRSAQQPVDVILIPPGATASDLAAAFAGLMWDRERFGLVPTEARRVRVLARRPPEQLLALVPHFEEELARLRAAPGQVVPGVGVARAIELRMRG